MNLLKDDIKKLYFKYLMPSLGSALAVSIYSFVDAIAVGQSAGPIGSASMAVITPLFSVAVFFGFLSGIGGSVLLSKARGEGDKKKSDSYFTTSLIMVSIFSVILWLVFGFLQKPIFRLFGADEELIPQIMEYSNWIIYFLPLFLFTPYLCSVVKNDGVPMLALIAVLVGGGVNIIGDYVLVFPLKLGMKGAGIATVCGTAVQVLIMAGYLFTKKCNLKLAKPQGLKSFWEVFKTGFGAGFLDLSVVILAFIVNNQIMRYGTQDHLAVYGMLTTICTLFQAMFCGIGQTAQPIVSANYGAGQSDRIIKVCKLSMITSVIMGLLFMCLGMFLPVPLTKMFMKATPEVLEIAPKIVRTYFSLFIFMGITIFTTYYMQSVLRPKSALIVSLMKGIVLSGLLFITLPIAMGIDGVWWAMPITEFITTILSVALIIYTNKQLKNITPVENFDNIEQEKTI